MTDQKSTTDPFFVNNAGVVLLAPFFPRLFQLLKLTEDRAFEHNDARLTALFSLQYVVSGKEEEYEHELIINKLLTGTPLEQSIPTKSTLTEEQKKIIHSMVESAKNHWDKLKNTSVEGFSQAFFQREGKLEIKEDYYLLTVEEKAYDVLLDSLPWNFRIIKHPWMEKRLEVKWR